MATANRAREWNLTAIFQMVLQKHKYITFFFPLELKNVIFLGRGKPREILQYSTVLINRGKVSAHTSKSRSNERGICWNALAEGLKKRVVLFLILLTCKCLFGCGSSQYSHSIILHSHVFVTCCSRSFLFTVTRQCSLVQVTILNGQASRWAYFK